MNSNVTGICRGPHVHVYFICFSVEQVSYSSHYKVVKATVWNKSSISHLLALVSSPSIPERNVQFKVFYR